MQPAVEPDDSLSFSRKRTRLIVREPFGDRKPA
jgi:hypothetical protein